jgi:hypothetical protein
MRLNKQARDLLAIKAALVKELRPQLASAATDALGNKQVNLSLKLLNRISPYRLPGEDISACIIRMLPHA